MNAKLKEFLLFFGPQVAIYALVSVSFRAVAQADYVVSVGVDVVYATMSFWVLRRIAKTEETTIGWIGYVLGSAVGTVIGIWGSILLLGK